MRSDINWRDPHTARRSLAGQIVLKVEGNERRKRESKRASDLGGQEVGKKNGKRSSERDGGKQSKQGKSIAHRSRSGRRFNLSSQQKFHHHVNNHRICSQKMQKLK